MVEEPESADHQGRLRTARALAIALRRARASQGLSQEEVAIRAGVSIHTYAHIERVRTPTGGLPNPTLDTLIRIARALNLDYLLDGGTS